MLPAHNWTPPYNVTLTKANRVVMPGAGGKVLYRDDADSASAATNSLVFYGKPAYTAAQAAFDAGVFINTPITADNAGNLFFGFVITGANPAGAGQRHRPHRRRRQRQLGQRRQRRRAKRR